MDRLDGASCLIYSKDGMYQGRFFCTITFENNQDNGNIFNNSIKKEKSIRITIKDIKKSIKDCEITFLNYREGKYYILDKYEVKTDERNDEDALISDFEYNIIPFIKEVSKEKYELLKNRNIKEIQWNRIKRIINGEEFTQDKVFEFLCKDLINKIKVTKEGSYQPSGGGDAGRDYKWIWPEIDDTNINFLDLPDNIWIMQCKYSSDTSVQLKKAEIWEEIVKVIQHNPNHYIIFTNRKITPSFMSWWDDIKKLDGRRSKFIPFSLHLVGKDDIEKLLNIWIEIKDKYFEL